MLNKKKFEMTLKKYTKNWMSFEEEEEDYKECESEILNIVELNNLDKDHILLIDLNTVSSYYKSKWKQDVLINRGNKPEELKKVQIVTFYQCMAQELYKTRYPNMMIDYNFREVITALIHFTMFGWEKEENILFNFIVDYLGQNIMEASDKNRHIWFLLELYLQYRNKTIVGTNQKVHQAVKHYLKGAELKHDLIPESLDVYEEVLSLWSTHELDKIQYLIDKMSLFHSKQASDIDNFSTEFGDYVYGFYPFEIQFLIYVRNKLGLPVPKQFDDLLMNTPEAKMAFEAPESYPEWDPLLSLIDNFYRKNYPDYIPKKHGELFK